VGNGAIHQALGKVKDLSLALDGVFVEHSNILKRVEIEKRRVAEQCGLNAEAVEREYNYRGQTLKLSNEIRDSQIAMAHLASGMEAVQAAAGVLDFSSVNSAIASSATAATLGGTLAGMGYKKVSEQEKIQDKQQEIEELESSHAIWKLEQQCTAAEVDSNARVDTMLLDIKASELQALRTSYQVELALAEVQRLFNEAKRSQTQQQEAEQMLINVQAARNDPNIRIYRNDAVINADIAFEDALRAVYRLTRVFEYYTSQSYARKEELFITRMVTAGQVNLENYLVELENAFFEFGEQYGVPSTRVMVLSMRDDIMQIPFVDTDGDPLSQSERIDMMRERLGDVSLLDSNGYLTLPFPTRLDRLSPLTRNHKVRYIETDIVGSDVGDTIGRVYLRQIGTGVIRNVADHTDYYVFPEKVAVINPFFNGNRVYEPNVYRNFRMRDRPVVNTNWELVINRRDEAANKDINLGALSDIRLLFYYTDFTELP
jgi:hypothetical protein